VAAAREEGIDKQIALEKDYAHLQEQYQVEYARRKISHNKLIEMMGNIRVICRGKGCVHLLGEFPSSL